MKNLVVSRPKDGEKNGAAKTDQVEAMEESEDGEQEEEAKEAETGKVAETQLNVVEIVSSIQVRLLKFQLFIPVLGPPDRDHSVEQQ